MYKKLITLILCCTALTLLSGCSSKPQETTQSESTNAPSQVNEIRIGCMKGPTAIGMIQLLSESDAGNTENTYQYTIAGAADELSAALIKGDLDIASSPCNLASVLYNKT